MGKNKIDAILPDLKKLIGMTVKIPEIGNVKIKSVQERKVFSEPKSGRYNIDVWFDKPVIINNTSFAYSTDVAMQIGKLIGVKCETSELGMQGDTGKNSDVYHANFDVEVV